MGHAQRDDVLPVERTAGEGGGGRGDAALLSTTTKPLQQHGRAPAEEAFSP
jgi:hypothetical protein